MNCVTYSLRCWLWASPALVVAACGTADPARTAAATGSGGGTASAAGGAAGSSGSTSQGIPWTQMTSTGAGGQDAAPDVPFVPGPFDCAGCLCDGATHFCLVAHGGSPPPPPPPEPLCPEDASDGPCFPLPSACMGHPSCACANPAPYPPGLCFCTEAGGGVSVSCNLQ
jgi:hypothetical protein